MPANPKANTKDNAKANTKKRARVVIVNGVVHIEASFNTTGINITDLDGNTLAWSTAGCMGFKGSRKSTPYAAQQAATKAAQAAIDNYGMRNVEIYVKGPGPGREAAAKAISNSFDKVTAIYDVTGIPHNGCRAPKERRV